MFKLLLTFIVTIGTVSAAPILVTTDDIQLRFVPRSANQMNGFYYARGFPEPMLEILNKQCYITVGIHNKSQKKIWLELANWNFSANGKPLKREHRDNWKKRWMAMKIPLRYQSTFRWTLIPETLDYLPGEKEGGNIILPFTKEPITLTARFATGENKKGKPIEITYDKLYCAVDAS